MTVSPAVCAGQGSSCPVRWVTVLRAMAECGMGSFLSGVRLQERQEMGSEHGLGAAWTLL